MTIERSILELFAIAPHEQHAMIVRDLDKVSRMNTWPRHSIEWFWPSRFVHRLELGRARQRLVHLSVRNEFFRFQLRCSQVSLPSAFFRRGDR
jgi:hypothetical protein